MKITIGWWKARDGSKWHVDWVGNKRACGHNDQEIGKSWSIEGRVTHVGTDENDIVSPWTGSNLLQWKREEVPHCDWFRFKDNPLSWVKVDCVDSNFIYFSNGYEGTLETLKDIAEHSGDGGKTWHPCGVMEEQS